MKTQEEERTEAYIRKIAHEQAAILVRTIRLEHNLYVEDNGTRVNIHLYSAAGNLGSCNIYIPRDIKNG